MIFYAPTPAISMMPWPYSVQVVRTLFHKPMILLDSGLDFCKR